MDAPIVPNAAPPAAPAPNAAPAPAVAAAAAAPAAVPPVTQVRTESTVTVAAAAVAVVALIAYLAQRTAGAIPLAPNPAGLGNLATALAPLLAAAAFIERAVEVVITATRDRGALLLQQNVAATDGATRGAWQQKLDIYRLHTQRYSFLTSFFLAVFAALVGVRAVAPLVNLSALAGKAHADQAYWFALFDISVTALLLAGGADGIHQVVTTLTDFLDSTKSKMNAAQNPNP